MEANKWEDTIIPGHYSPEEFTRLQLQAKTSFKAGYQKGQIDREIESQQAYEAGKDQGRREGFKAGEDKGKQEGIKEVAEWGEEPCPHWVSKDHTRRMKRLCPECWQAFRKERGIEK